jgi:hypothetical protein
MHVIGEDTWKRLDVVPAGDCHASSQNMPAGPAWMDETVVENDKIVCLTLSDEWRNMEKTAFRGATKRSAIVTIQASQHHRDRRDVTAEQHNFGEPHRVLCR